MQQDILLGNAHCLGENIDTDVIISGKYVNTLDMDDLASHCLEAVYPNFAASVQQGDFIVAGRNFGCGSSREIAPELIHYAGIRLIIAPSFARIFYRNAINLGLLAVECPGIDAMVQESDTITYNLASGLIRNETRGGEAQGSVIPEFILDIWRQGGAVAASKKKMLGKA